MNADKNNTAAEIDSYYNQKLAHMIAKESAKQNFTEDKNMQMLFKIFDKEKRFAVINTAVYSGDRLLLRSIAKNVSVNYRTKNYLADDPNRLILFKNHDELLSILKADVLRCVYCKFAGLEKKFRFLFITTDNLLYDFYVTLGEVANYDYSTES